MSPIAVEILVAVIPPLMSILGAVLVILVKAAFERMPSNVQPLLKEVAKTAVSSTEQVASAELNGPGKKEKAIEFFQEQLAHYHLDVPLPVISAVIEEAVREMNLTTAAPIKASVTTENISK